MVINQKGTNLINNTRKDKTSNVKVDSAVIDALLMGVHDI